MNVIIFVNKNANNLNGWNKWLRIKDTLQYIIPYEISSVIPYTPPFDFYAPLKKEVGRNTDNLVISAGGDGTLNRLVNAVMRLDQETRERIYLGVIGLGSSNDSTKPSTCTIDGIPVRLNLDRITEHDLGFVRFLDEDNTEVQKYFIVNASMGILAEANHLFNSGDWFINRFKHKMVHPTIHYTALKTLLKYRMKTISISCGMVDAVVRMNTLSVLINPYISGNLKYREYSSQSNLLELNYCQDMSRLEILKVIRDLGKGAFQRKKSTKRVTMPVEQLDIDSRTDLVIETDGEVYRGRNIRFNISPHKIKILGNDF